MQGDWEAVGHGLERGWLELARALGPSVLGLVLAWLVARAWLRRRRYRAVDALSEVDRNTLATTVAEAERRTAGEIVVVVVERSDEHPDAGWKAAIFVLALGTLALAAALPWGHPALLVLAQLAMGGVGWLLARSLPGFRRAFVAEARASEVAEEQALQEFGRLEINRAEGRTGVLIFVSLLEQRVVVLADEAAHAAVGEGGWVAVDQAVLDGVAKVSLRAGLERGIAAAGEVLAEKLPPDGDGPNRLSDEIEVRRS